MEINPLTLKGFVVPGSQSHPDAAEANDFFGPTIFNGPNNARNWEQQVLGFRESGCGLDVGHDISMDEEVIYLMK